MNNFINTINVEGVDYDIQTSVNPPLVYSENNSLCLQIGTGLVINDGDLIAEIAHNFYQFNSIIIDPEYWLVDHRGYLLPSSTLQIGQDVSSLKIINTLLIGSGLDLQNNLLRLRGIPISTYGGSETQYIDQLIIGPGLQVSDNVINITVPISTDNGSSVSYLKSLNIGQGFKYENGELSVEYNQPGGGIHIATAGGTSIEDAPFSIGIRLSDDFSFNTDNSLLSLNLSFDSEEFTQDYTGHVTLKYDSKTLATTAKGLTLSTNMKGLGDLPNDTYGIKTTSPLYINDDNQVSIHIGTALYIGANGLGVSYDSTYFTQNDNGELTLSDIIKEKLGL